MNIEDLKKLSTGDIIHIKDIENVDVSLVLSENIGDCRTLEKELLIVLKVAEVKSELGEIVAYDIYCFNDKVVNLFSANVICELITKIG